MPPITVELSMIVKDGAKTLARCLQSVAGVIDRIVIGDTGSTDDSIAIARTFNADVRSIPWTGDFSAARNSVLRHAAASWILVLDADEMLDPAGRATLRQLVSTSEPDAYDVTRWNYVRETNSRSGDQGALPNPGLLPEAASFPAYVKSVNTRLFRRQPGIYFERPVHETVIHRIRQLGLRIAPAPFVIHHLGHAEDEQHQRAAKNVLYQQIGLKHLATSPNDARTCVELGLGELEHFKNPAAALTLFVRAGQLEGAKTEATILAGVCLVRLQRYAEAADLLSQAAAQGARSIVLDETLGDALFHQQHYAAALHCYRRARAQGSGSAILLAKQSICEIDQGLKVEGMQGLRRAHAMEPSSPDLADIVIAGAATCGETTFAAHLAEQRLSMGEATPLHRSIAEILRQQSRQLTS